MRIFLSYARQDREHAESIYLTLRDQGHKVFFDRADLPAGEEYHNRIRAAIEKSELFLFLISPDAIDTGSYTLTELEIAARARIKLLPVLLEKTPLESLPPPIKTVTFLQTDGNLPAAVAAEVHRIASALQRKRLNYFAAALLAALIAGGAVFSIMRTGAHPQRIGKDGAPAVLIPSGSFIMGDDDNSPRREIFLDAFYLDRYEVTAARYANFLKATGNLMPPDQWEKVNLRDRGDLPVVGVNWQDASGYCHWAGKRLPTEAEWEKGARGSDERVYPWGNDTPALNYARYGKLYEIPVYQDGVAPVGSYAKDTSPFGVADCAANVTEWVADWFGETFPAGDLRNPKGPQSGTDRVLRGANWYEPAERLSITKRSHADPATRNEGIGFRCASD